MAVSTGSRVAASHSLFIDEPKIGRLSLDFDKYVISITNLILHSEPQFTIGIFGNWGTGKSTILRNIKEKLKNEHKCACLEFDAWQYEQETTQMSIPLVLAIIAEIYKNNKVEIDKFDKERNQNFKENLNRVFSGLSLNLKFGIPGMADLDLGYDFSKVSSNDSSFRFLSTKRRIERFALEQTKLQEGIDLIRKLIDMDVVKGTVENEKLKLVVFIDDLDRCTPEKAAEIFEVVKIFLGIKGIVYVMGLSNTIVQAAIEKKYEHLKGQFKGEEYLRKIIQLQFPIPQLVDKDVTTYLLSLLDEYNHYEYNNFFSKNKQLIALGVEPNLREIKRYLNNFILSFEIAKSKNQASLDEQKKFLAFHIIRQRWEWFYNSYFSDKEFPNKIQRIIMQQEKPDPNDAQVQAILTNPSLYNFLNGIGGETIFDISQDEQARYKKATSNIDLPQPQKKKSKRGEYTEKEDYKTWILRFGELDEKRESQLWMQAARDPKFAYELGYSLGGIFADITSKKREDIFEMVTQNDDFARGLGSSLGRGFTSLTEDLQNKILNLAKRKDEFAETLASSLGTHFNFLDPKIKEQLLRVSESNAVVAEGLGRNLGMTFHQLDGDSRNQVWDMVRKNERFAAALGSSLGENFANLDDETSQKALEVAETSPLFAKGLGTFLGRDLGWLSNEMRDKVLVVALKSQAFAESFLDSVLNRFEVLPSNIKEIFQKWASEYPQLSRANPKIEAIISKKDGRSYSDSLNTRIIFMSSNPHGNLDISSEYNKIEASLKNSSNYMRFELLRENNLDEVDSWWNAIQKNIPAQIYHISGIAEDERGIILSDKEGRDSRVLSFDRLSDFFEVISNKNKIILVFLATCYSGRAAKKISRYVDCVIGIDNFANEDQVIKFVEVFYQSVGNGKSVKDAYHDGKEHMEGSVKTSLKNRDGIDPSEVYFT